MAYCLCENIPNTALDAQVARGKSDLFDNIVEGGQKDRVGSFDQPNLPPIYNPHQLGNNKNMKPHPPEVVNQSSEYFQVDGGKEIYRRIHTLARDFEYTQGRVSGIHDLVLSINDEVIIFLVFLKSKLFINRSNFSSVR